MTNRRTLAGLLTPLLLGAPAPGARACGFYEPTLFVSPYAPDAPAVRYVAGELGVLQPTWIRAYLVVAYRQLAGIPLTPGEQAAAVAYLEGRNPAGTEGLEAWSKSREAATGQPTGRIETERPAGYLSYVNCGDDAFRRAAATLDAYVLKFGRTAAATTAWREAQDLVFANCAGTEARIPQALPASAPLTLRSDRAYQIASANFYAGRLPEAQTGFEAIASDSESPWKAVAPYLAARAVLRRETLGEKSDPDLLREARRRFAALASGSPSPDVRRWSADLVRFVDVRLEPASRLPAAAARVLAPGSPEEFGPDFVHYRDLLFRVLGWGPEPGEYTPDAKDDLTSWIVAFQDPFPRGLERALAGFARTPSPPWIAAVLSKLPASHPRAAEVVAAARRLPAGAPGHLHVAYHLARLATQAGRITEARALVDANLDLAAATGISAKNLFLELKVRNAATFEEFTAAAPRRAVEGSMTGRGDVFDDYASDILSRRLPLDTLVRFASTAPLEPESAAAIRRVVLTRAILLGRPDVARRFSPPGARVDWDRPAWRVDATLAILIEDSNSRPYVALDPDFSIAWWCSLPDPIEGGREPAFLSDAERRAAADEVVRLAAEPPAATWFCRQALAFAKASPDDPRAPQLLARAVRTTREGCGDGETRQLSKSAFQLLHRRYPKSRWASETKYWFEGRGLAPKVRRTPPS